MRGDYRGKGPDLSCTLKDGKGSACSLPVEGTSSPSGEKLDVNQEPSAAQDGQKEEGQDFLRFPRRGGKRERPQTGIHVPGLYLGKPSAL